MDRFMLRGKLKDLMLGIWVIPHIMGPLTMFDITLTGVRKMGRVVNSNVTKRPLSSTALHCHGLLKLPLSSLMETFSCAKVRLWMTLDESKDTMILSFFQRHKD